MCPVNIHRLEVSHRPVQPQIPFLEVQGSLGGQTLMIFVKQTAAVVQGQIPYKSKVVIQLNAMLGVHLAQCISVHLHLVI